MRSLRSWLPTCPWPSTRSTRWRPGSSCPAMYSRDDLLSSAQMALVEAAKRYDPAMGASFATYAMTRLQGAVLDELRSADWASRSVRAETRRLEAALDALTSELGQAAHA